MPCVRFGSVVSRSKTCTAGQRRSKLSTNNEPWTFQGSSDALCRVGSLSRLASWIGDAAIQEWQLSAFGVGNASMQMSTKKDACGSFERNGRQSHRRPVTLK
mmetsp:Transcript_83439/g.193978  ORF Transcript_83439/g.193978 Transcript_83439/m.193978 type:complete len:102 (+) Transcript_83439:127-432(+)